MARKVATTVYITQQQSADLGLLSAALERSVAGLIREAVDEVLAKHAKPQAPQPAQGSFTLD